MFKITENKGFQITFANGNTVSVQFGPHNYCDNRDLNADYIRELPSQHSATAEVAAWNKHGIWHQLGENDSVVGYVKPNELLVILNHFANHQTGIDTNDEEKTGC